MGRPDSKGSTDLVAGRDLSHFGLIPAFVVVAVIVFAVALTGIAIRLADISPAFWPANALLLGLMVRIPSLRSPLCWPAAFVAFVAADLLTGTGFSTAIWLALANLTFVGTGLFLFRGVHRADKALMRPNSILYVVGVSVAAGMVAGLVAAFAQPSVGLGSTWETWKLWAASDTAHAMAILPLVLACPSLAGHPFQRFKMRRGSDVIPVLEPVGVLIVALALGYVIGGASAIAIAVPALLWCALRASVFETTLLTMLANVWTVLVVASGHLDIGGVAAGASELTSVHIALSLASIGPIAVACTMTTRERQLINLQRTANRDDLTGAMSRGAFMVDSQRVIAELAADDRLVGVIVLDVDSFKEINDSQGHAAGDRVLVRLVEVVSAQLRDSDMLGRVGGDEFAVVLPGIRGEILRGLAERMRLAVAESLEADEPGAAATISLGTALSWASDTSLESILEKADEALYEAKHRGRNRVGSSVDG